MARLRCLPGSGPLIRRAVPFWFVGSVFGQPGLRDHAGGEGEAPCRCQGIGERNDLVGRGE